jgi:NAD(P)-dependent dehydrogenase (short-subunit alcohol dehydrogenase family)
MIFKDKRVVITGGGTGIGKALAKEYIKNGASVIINGRRKDVLELAAHELDPTFKKIDFLVGDIKNINISQDLINKCISKFGRIDILINNAGIFAPKVFLEHTEKDFYDYIDIILKGTFFTSQFAIKEMRKKGGGSIVNIGSMWALEAIEATPSSAYSAAKAGVHALTKNLAIEHAKDKIRVNAVAPAVVSTPIYESFIDKDEIEEVLESFNNFHPLGRIANPEDIVEAVLFLSSEKASFITGVVLPVDGGVTAGKHLHN